MTSYQDLLELMRTRRSIRRFTEQPVEREQITRLWEAARWAPSNHNRQPWKFLLLADRSRIQDLAGAIGQQLTIRLRRQQEIAASYAQEVWAHAILFATAPVLIVALHKRPVRISAKLLGDIREPNWVSGEPLSVAMAVQNILLVAPTLGLGACVMTAPLLVSEVITCRLPVPPGFDLNCFIALGYPAESPEAPRRKNLEHIVDYLDDVPAAP